MVAKPHLEDAGSARAGMPLARAQRLNARSSTKRSGGGGIAIAVGTVLAAIVGVSLYASSGIESVPAATSAALAEPILQTPPPLPSVMPDPLPTPVAAPVQQVWVPPCIARIERALETLHGTRTPDHAWPIKRENLKTLAQSGLDCTRARVEMNGNFELAETALASLHVSWDRDDGVLGLTIIDSVALSDHPEIITEAGQPVDFVVQ